MSSLFAGTLEDVGPNLGGATTRVIIPEWRGKFKRVAVRLRNLWTSACASLQASPSGRDPRLDAHGHSGGGISVRVLDSYVVRAGYKQFMSTTCWQPEDLKP